MRQAGLASVLFVLLGGCGHRVPAPAPREFGLIKFYHGDDPDLFPDGFCWGVTATPRDLVGTKDAQAVGVGVADSNCLGPREISTSGAVVTAGTYEFEFLRKPLQGTSKPAAEWVVCHTQLTIAAERLTEVKDVWTAANRCTVTTRTSGGLLSEDDPLLRSIHHWRTRWMDSARERCAALPARQKRRACLEHEREMLHWKTRP